jgi:nucleoside-diphosphate-sugar epimerase
VTRIKFTILGGGGFIGSRLARYLRARGDDVIVPARDTQSLAGAALGHVIYAIGMTGNFRAHPEQAVEAHVTALGRLMAGARYDSWLYLSSTRVYGGLPADAAAAEDSAVPVRPGADSLYDISKLLGESMCLGRDEAGMRVARLSNVYGAGQSRHTFLGSIAATLRQDGTVSIGETADSAKDYVSIDDVMALLPEIAVRGRERIYNVASGENVSHGALAAAIAACGHGDVTFAQGARRRTYPRIAIDRIRDEFGFSPRRVIDDIADVVGQDGDEKQERG